MPALPPGYSANGTCALHRPVLKAKTEIPARTVINQTLLKALVVASV